MGGGREEKKIKGKERKENHLKREISNWGKITNLACAVEAQYIELIEAFNMREQGSHFSC